MKALREAAGKKLEIKEAWTDSLQDCISLLSTVFRRLSWNDKQVRVSPSLKYPNK